MRRVMVNSWSTWYRRRWRGERPSEIVLDQAASSDVAAEVTIRLAVRDALGVLTDRQRTVVVLRLFDDLSEVLKVSYGWPASAAVLFARTPS